MEELLRRFDALVNHVTNVSGLWSFEAAKLRADFVAWERDLICNYCATGTYITQAT